MVKLNIAFSDETTLEDLADKLKGILDKGEASRRHLMFLHDAIRNTLGIEEKLEAPLTTPDEMPTGQLTANALGLMMASINVIENQLIFMFDRLKKVDLRVTALRDALGVDATEEVKPD